MARGTKGALAMKVMIVGSKSKLDAAETEAFVEACRQIGAALAENGIGIVIGSEEERYADRHVLDGFAEAGKLQPVVMIRADSDATALVDAYAGSKITLTSRRVRSWLAGRVPLLLEADAVLVIAGGERTASTAFMGVALEKPVLVVACFGGKSKEVYRELEPYYRNLGSVSDNIDALNRPWSERNVPLVIAALKELVSRGVFRTKPRQPFGLYMGLMMLCLVAWVVAFNSDRLAYSYSLFIILGVAGLLGTMLRNNLRMVFDPTARFSWDELLIEVGTGLLLAFALALLYLVGAVTIKGNAEVMFPTGPAEFQRVAVVMTLLGLGGGLMIEQAADRVRGWFLDRFGASGR